MTEPKFDWFLYRRRACIVGVVAIFLLYLVYLVWLFVPINRGAPVPNNIDHVSEGPVGVYHDHERHVTCWVNSGISCIPDDQLDLRPDGGRQ
jgi:predicted PurR-regulated permease PerM